MGKTISDKPWKNFYSLIAPIKTKCTAYCKRCFRFFLIDQDRLADLKSHFSSKKHSSVKRLKKLKIVKGIFMARSN